MTPWADLAQCTAARDIMDGVNVEDAFNDGPIEYMDGTVEMRLRLEKGIAICLEWKCVDTWVEVSSMRPAAFAAFLDRTRVTEKEKDGKRL